MNNGMKKRRLIPGVIVLLLAAFIGLFAINIDQVAAEKGQDKVHPPMTAGTTEEATAESFDVGVPVGSIVKMVSALVIVVFCIYIGLLLLKRLMNSRYRGKGRDDLLEVIHTTYVGPKKMVSLVRVADRSVLVGITDQSISMLTELDAEETAEVLTEEPRDQSAVDFSGVLRSAGDKIKSFRLKRNAVVQEG
jgi:flagellar biogenesis protein FliO